MDLCKEQGLLYLQRHAIVKSGAASRALSPIHCYHYYCANEEDAKYEVGSRSAENINH